MVTYLSRFNQNGEYNFIINDITPRQYLPILSDPTDEDTDDDSINDDIDPEPLKKAYIKPFGTEEYKKEVEEKAKEGKFVYEWYMTANDIMARNFYNFFNDIDEEIVPAYIVAKTKLDIMMQDVNDCEQYLFTVSDENWLNFCLFFNECVQTYGKVDEELHYFRLKLNRAPATLEEMISLINSSDKNNRWKLYGMKKTRYHMFGTNGEYNLKFGSSKNTGYCYEAVYNKDGILLTEHNSPVNMGTYNYCSDQYDKDLHQKLDVDPYKKFGNTPDKSSKYPGDTAKEENGNRYNANKKAQEHRADVERRLP